MDSSSKPKLTKIGFIFQFYHLLPEFTALENVAMPLLLARRGRDEAHGAARVLDGLGMLVEQAEAAWNIWRQYRK